MLRLIALSLLIAAPVFAAAADPPASHPAAAENRMAPLAGLVGTWRGTGWVLLPNGTRSEFESQEVVTSRIGGAALLVEGRHWQPGNPDEVVHDAIGLITWDARGGGHRFHTALANGQSGDFAMDVGEGRFSWRIDTPQGPMDYVSEFADGTWRERGRMTLPRGRTVDFFEMTLTRN
jgi:hypothetical protein